MDYVELGNSDLEVSRLCLGTWNMAGMAGWGPDDDEQSIDLIRRAQDTGCNFFDSAHVYGRGRAEEVLGRALEPDGRRDLAVVATKVMPCAADRVEPALDQALRRLRTDRVDLYVMHWPAEDGQVRPTLEGMAQVKQKGKAREIGVSNFNLEQMQAAAEYGVVSLQPPFNILWRRIEPDVLRFCIERGISVTPYSPLAQGLLTGRFSRASEPLSGIRKANRLFHEPVFSHARKVAQIVDEVADAYGCTSSQIALAWLLRTEGVAAPIVGISKWSHWEENLGALEVELSDEDYTRLSAAGMEVWRTIGEGAKMWF